MNLSQQAQNIYTTIESENTKLGDLRKIAKEISVNHSLANELWSTAKFMSRLMAILIMDKKELDNKSINTICHQIQNHNVDQQMQLGDWLMANQLTKAKKTIAIINSWENSELSIQRRIFWYYQARLRWTGQSPPNNTEILLTAIETKMLGEKPEVQWAMNFTAAWIGIYEDAFRNRCIEIGHKLGLYKDEVVPKNCHPNFLPKFIESELNKRTG